MNKFSRSPKVSQILQCGALALLLQSAAQADDVGWYGGLSIGQSRAKINDARIANDLLGPNSNLGASDHQDNDTGYKVFGGYQLNPYLAIEGSYADGGKSKFTETNIAPAGTLTGNIQPDGFSLGLLGILPVTSRFSAFLRGGILDGRTKSTLSTTGTAFGNPDSSRTSHYTDWKYGVGVQYALSESFAVRAEAERYRMDDTYNHTNNVDLISVGLVYRFGAHEEPAPARMADVAPVAAPMEPPPPPPAPPPPPPAPAEPPPVVMAPPPMAPPPPAPHKVSLSADSLFVFGKSDVHEAGKEALNRLATELKTGTFDTIKVTGHTDRIGTHDYNLKLSLARAEAVKAYLVETAGLPADRIITEGTDGSDPVTKPEDCPGHGRSAKRILCLQPDRRVDVEVLMSR